MPSKTIYFLTALTALSTSQIVVGASLHQSASSPPTSPETFTSGADDASPNDRPDLKPVPQYVLDYSPLVHLYTDEEYWPSDISEHLDHTTPFLNYTPAPVAEWNRTVNNLGELNKYDRGKWVYLQSQDNVEDKPDWLTSRHNKPVFPKEETVIGPVWPDEKSWWGSKKRKEKRSEKHIRRQTALEEQGKGHVHAGGRSSAPAVLVVVEKEDGIVDAFWFYYYSYNLGNTVFKIRFGNHVGDWEHSVVRFKHGVPTEVFLSEHAFGSSYTYEAVEKNGKRPVIYSATGTHAMYARPGNQPYILPFGLLKDRTDRGPLWDPTQNLYAYHYNTSLARGRDRSISHLNVFLPSAALTLPSDILTVASLTPDAPTSWFHYAGAWGDKTYPNSDRRQYTAPVIGEKHYVSGPVGPRFKALGRVNICPQKKCSLRTNIEARHWALVILINWGAAAIVLLLATGLGILIFVSCRMCGVVGRKRVREAHSVGKWAWGGVRRFVGRRGEKGGSEDGESEEGDEEAARRVDDERRPLLGANGGAATAGSYGALANGQLASDAETLVIGGDSLSEDETGRVKVVTEGEELIDDDEE